MTLRLTFSISLKDNLALEILASTVLLMWFEILTAVNAPRDLVSM